MCGGLLVNSGKDSGIPASDFFLDLYCLETSLIVQIGLLIDQ